MKQFVAELFEDWRGCKEWTNIVQSEDILNRLFIDLLVDDEGFFEMMICHCDPVEDQRFRHAA